MNTSTFRTHLTTIASIVTFLVGAPLAFAQSVPTMDPGETSASVSALQTFLAADASVYPQGLITGYYGSLTTAAIQRYQCKYGIVCQGTPSTTGYGRVGPTTAAKIASQGGFMGGAGGADVSAPILTDPTVATTATSATIRWGASENALNSVLFSTVMPSLSPESFASMTAIADPNISGSGVVTLGGLAANTRYYYVLRSMDTHGNIQYSLYGMYHPFVTSI